MNNDMVTRAKRECKKRQNGKGKEKTPNMH